MSITLQLDFDRQDMESVRHRNSFPGVTAYLIVHDGQRAIEFYENALDARLMHKLQDSTGRIGHAELEVGDGVIMLADEVVDMDIKSPETLGGSGTGLLIYVDDPHAVFEKAVSIGAKPFKPVMDQFYGELSGTFEDPFGHRWTVARTTENLTWQEIRQRYTERFIDPQ